MKKVSIVILLLFAYFTANAQMLIKSEEGFSPQVEFLYLCLTI